MPVLTRCSVSKTVFIIRFAGYGNGREPGLRGLLERVQDHPGNEATGQLPGRRMSTGTRRVRRRPPAAGGRGGSGLAVVRRPVVPDRVVRKRLRGARLGARTGHQAPLRQTSGRRQAASAFAQPYGPAEGQAAEGQTQETRHQGRFPRLRSEFSARLGV